VVKAMQGQRMKRMGIVAVALAAIVMPAAGLMAQQPAAAPAEKADVARIQKGRDLFSNWGCSGCHSLADADAHGDVGPHFDGAGLTEDFIKTRVTNGQGAMPAFGGQMTQQEIADIAYYIAHVAKK
jgi:mono/diheme cytochrome c family protein